MLTLGAALALAKKNAGEAITEALAEYPSGFTYKGSVNYESDLPTGASAGDAYTVKYAGNSGTIPSGAEYVYDGSNWIRVGQDLKLYRDEDGDLCEED